MKSHIVSQLLLRRFCIKNRIKAHNLIVSGTRILTPEEIAYIEVPNSLFTKIERKFGQIETRAATAFQALDNGTLFNSPKDIDSIKQLMVLHFVRSAAILQMFARDEKKYFGEFIDSAKESYPDEVAEIDRNIEVLRKKWLVDLTKNIPISFKDNIKKVGDYINQFDIEIGVAPLDTQFLLGDTPAFNLSDDGRVGVLGGVGITNSVAFAMPLSPKYVVAVIAKGKSSKYKQLTSKEVGSLNARLLSICIAEYYTSP